MYRFTSPAILASILFVAGTALCAPVMAQSGTAPPPATKHAAPPSPAEGAKAKPSSDPYTLAICPISGGKLGSMGEPIVKVYDGREVRFCCASCPPKFEKDLAASMAKLDAAVVKDQLALYPLGTSVVSSKSLSDQSVNWVYGNRLVRLADETEKTEFQKDPAKYLAALDKAVVQKQSTSYPLKTCPVSKEALGGMGEPKNLVLGGRLIRLCCADCEKDARRDPSKYILVVDEARFGETGKKDAETPKNDAHDDHDQKAK